MPSHEMKKQRKHGPGYPMSLGRQSTVCDGDDLAVPTSSVGEWDDESGMGSDDQFFEAWKSPRRALRARRKLERIMERKSLDASLGDVYDEVYDDDWTPPQRRRQRHERLKSKQSPQD